MRYLKDQERPADTYFNEWPVPMFQLSQMPKTSQDTHDKIFADDAARDAGAGDGDGHALLEDLGDKVVPFPREMRMELTREKIHVWGINTGVILMPASGQSTLAFLLERKRAVAVCKNADHKTFVHENLAKAVKALGLAPDKRPTKPAELVRWETTHSQVTTRSQVTCPTQTTQTQAPTVSTAQAPAPAPEVITIAPAQQSSASAASPAQGSGGASNVSVFGAGLLR